MFDSRFKLFFVFNSRKRTFLPKVMKIIVRTKKKGFTKKRIKGILKSI